MAKKTEAASEGLGVLQDLSGTTIAEFQMLGIGVTAHVFNSGGSQIGSYYKHQDGQASVYDMEAELPSSIEKWEGDGACVRLDLVVEKFFAKDGLITDEGKSECARYDGDSYGALAAFLLLNC